MWALSHEVIAFELGILERWVAEAVVVALVDWVVVLFAAMAALAVALVVALVVAMAALLVAAMTAVVAPSVKLYVLVEEHMHLDLL